MVGGIMKELPEDMVIYILLRLPVKSLLRFQCTCKTFCNIIKSSTFIDLHLNCSNNTKNELILFKHSVKQDEPNLFKNILSFLLSEKDAFDFKPVSPDVEVPHLTTTSASVFHQLIGPCNGLIALSDSLTIIVFNPTTRNYKLIPPCPFGIPKDFRRSISGVGFGFDSIANNYKFVRISEVYKDPCEKDMKVDIYDLCIDSWRELNGQQLPIVFWTPCSEILYKSAFHWFAIEHDTIIICFGMSTEIFYNMDLPDTCHWFDGKCYGLGILCNSLTLISYPDPMSTNPMEDLIDIWIMEEYTKRESWIKRFSIGPLPIESPLTVWRDELLLLQSKSGHLIAYNLNTDEVKELNLHGFPTSLRVVVYKESLTLIPRNVDSTEVQLFKSCNSSTLT